MSTNSDVAIHKWELFGYDEDGRIVKRNTVDRTLEEADELLAALLIHCPQVVSVGKRLIK